MARREQSPATPPVIKTPGRTSLFAWRLARTVVSLAALGVTGWSLYAVAIHYGAPPVVAGAGVAVFDGTAYACLRLASDASAAGRSAAGARIASLINAGISVYLNAFHSSLINGGMGATLLFAAPTLALLAVSELSWTGPRHEARAARGERPFRPPLLGGWSWTIAPLRAGRQVRAQALDYIDRGGRPEVKPEPAPVRTASDMLRERFGQMDPAEVIRIAHESQPMLPPGELASLLITYGVIVDAVMVALVLNGHPPTYTTDRVRTAPDKPLPADPRIELARADMLSGQRPEGITDAVRRLMHRQVTDRDAVVSITCDVLGPDTNPDTVRRTFDREIDKLPPPDSGVGQGGQGYT